MGEGKTKTITWHPGSEAARRWLLCPDTANDGTNLFGRRDEICDLTNRLVSGVDEATFVTALRWGMSDWQWIC